MPEFKGTIRLEDGNGDGLESNLMVDSGRLVVTAGEHEIGNWGIGDLSVKRRNADFHISVEGESLVVVAADPVGLAQVLEIKDRASKKRRAKKPKSKRPRRTERNQLPADPQTATTAVVDPTPPVDPPPVATVPPSDSLSPYSASEPLPTPAINEVQTPGETSSLWDRLSSRTKLAGAGVIALAVLGVFAPSLLALLLLLVGMVTLFLGIAARSEGATAFLPPPFFATTAAAGGGIGLVLLAVVIIAIT